MRRQIEAGGKPKMANISQKWLNVLLPFSNNYLVSMSAREISKIIKMPQRTTTRIVKNLSEAGLIRYSVEGIARKYYLDLKDSRTKVLINLLENFKALKFYLETKNVAAIIEKLSLKKGVIVFGSYANGLFTEKSDLDLLIIGKKDRTSMKIIRSSLTKVNAHFSDIESFEKSLKNKNTLAREIAGSHIIINCPEFIELLWRYYNEKL